MSGSDVSAAELRIIWPRMPIPKSGGPMLIYLFINESNQNQMINTFICYVLFLTSLYVCVSVPVRGF